MHERSNPDGAPGLTGEGYATHIAHGDIDNDGVVDMVVSIPGDVRAGPGSLVVYKGIIGDAEGRTSFARAGIIEFVVAQSLLVKNVNDDEFDDIVVGASGASGEEVRIYLGSGGFKFGLPVIIEAWDADGSTAADDYVRPWDPLGPGYQIGSTSGFGQALAFVEYQISSGTKKLLAVGAPLANAYHYYDGSTTGICDDTGGISGLSDCEEGTGAVFLYDKDLNLVEILDPYALDVGGNRTGALFGKSIAFGQFDKSTSCPSLAIGAPYDHRIVQDPVTLAFISAQSVPGSSTHNLIAPLWLTTGLDEVGQVYVAFPDVSAGCVDWTYNVNSGTSDETDSEFGWSLAAGPMHTERSTSWDDLAVGAPNSEESDVPLRTGAVYIYDASPEFMGGNPTLIDTAHKRLDLDSTSTCGSVNPAGDRFGETLAVGDFVGYSGVLGTSAPVNSSLAVGAPFRAVCSSPEAEGAVYAFMGESGGWWSEPEERLLLSDACTTSRSSTGSVKFGAALSTQPLGRFSSNPLAISSSNTFYPAGVVDWPFGRTDLWMGAPGAFSDGSTAADGLVQSRAGYTRYQGVGVIHDCY